MAVRQLFGNQVRSYGQQRAFHLFATDANEVTVGNAVRLIDLALVAAFQQRAWGNTPGVPAAPIRMASGAAETSLSA
jgi:hypothetical protein